MNKFSKMKLVHIKPSAITIPRDYPRTEPTSSFYLGNSIMKDGQITPIIIDAKKNLIAGKRRLTEVKKKRYRKIWAVMHTNVKKPQTRYLFSVLEVLHQVDLNPMEKAVAFRNLKKIYNTSGRGLAKILNISKSTIEYHLKLLELPKETKKRMRSGELKAYSVEKQIFKKRLKTHADFVRATDMQKFNSVIKRLIPLRSDISYAKFDLKALKNIQGKVKEILDIIEERVKKIEKTNEG